MTAQQQFEDHVMDLLAETNFDVDAVIETLIDEDVSQGEYAGCSVDLELSHLEYTTQVGRIMRELGMR